MRQELKRIEAALGQIADKHSSVSTVSLPLSEVSTQEMLGDSVNSPAPSDALRVSLPMLPILSTVRIQNSSATIADAVSKEKNAEPLAANFSEIKTPTLPKVKTPSFSSHRNAANPTLAMNLLKEMEVTVAGWQEELQQVLKQIQDLYMEGPIVDGWLESYAQQNGEAPEFRHADVNCLMDYVEKLRTSSQQNLDQAAGVNNPPKPQQEINIAGSGYRLCGLNEDGQLWFRHCPAEQVPSVGMAIARYQRLRLLLSRKQYLETRLGQLAETLVMVHGRLIA